MKKRISSLIITLLLIVQIATGQKDEKKSDKPITISGKVIGPGNQPVSGAVFYVDNIKTSYITNEQGAYKIKVSPSAYKLKVSSSRFGVLDTLLNGQTKINFIFRSNENTPDALAGDNNQDHELSKSKQKPKKMITYNNIYQMIQNEVSGVVVNGRSLIIQQPNSFYGSSDPLFVVDGVIVPSIDNINPVEVKSISVLTGSAASLYGVRGANGVISITLINGTEIEK
jgi:TonB-dependent SusC/RagA subfamily outer membrane receptor